MLGHIGAVLGGPDQTGVSAQPAVDVEQLRHSPWIIAYCGSSVVHSDHPPPTHGSTQWRRSPLPSTTGGDTRESNRE
jgi:hypothetical protein